MGEYLIQTALSNCLVALMIAVIAYAVQLRFRAPAVAHLLWAMVLVKLVTPPLFSVPMKLPGFVTSVPSTAATSNLTSDGVLLRDPARIPKTPSPKTPSPKTPSPKTPSPKTPASKTPASSSRSTQVASRHEPVSKRVESASPAAAIETTQPFWRSRSGWSYLIAGWLGGSLVLLIVSLVRIVRFHRLVCRDARENDQLSLGPCQRVARQLGIVNVPKVYVSAANLAPFVWWLEGRSAIVMPQQSLKELTNDDLKNVLGHELAHIKRWDHWLRWLEWAALLVAWWNPLAWWARRQLRMSEELACDELVLERTTTDVRSYASSLLNMAEWLATTSADRPPATVSAIDSGGSLEKRLKMMITNRNWKISSTLRMTIVALAVCVFPLGFAYAQDLDAIERRLGGAVEAGEITLAQANIMLDALRESIEADEIADDDADRERLERQFLRIEQQIDRAVENGELSEQEAQEKLEYLQRKMFGDHDDEEEEEDRWEEEEDDERWDEEREERERERELKRKYKLLERKFYNAVREGDLSEQETRERLEFLERDLFGDHDDDDDDDDEDEEERWEQEEDEQWDDDRSEEEHEREEHERVLKRKYKQLEREIDHAVREGDLTKEVAQEKLEYLQREMFGDHDDDDDDDEDEDRWEEEEDEDEQWDDDRSEEEREREEHERKLKRKYAQLEREIDRAVREGDLSKEEAQEKLEYLQREMFGDHDDDDDDDEDEERWEEEEEEDDDEEDDDRWEQEEREETLSQVSAEVLEASDDLIEMSVGTEDGIEQGNAFVVFRGERFLGRAEVIRVTPDRSVGRIVFRDAPIREGDQVQAKVELR